MNQSLKYRKVILCVGVMCAVLGANGPGAKGLAASSQVKQSLEVLEAYRLCQTFEHLLGENLDFDRAYEATFPRNKAMRRAIAIADGEFGAHDLAKIDDDLLITAYKRRMQLFYFILVLAGPSDEEAPIFFPPQIKQLLQRETPADSKEFGRYVLQLDQDVATFRTHLDRLSARYPSVADRIQKFKSGALSAKYEPPTNRKVEPIYGYYRSQVLKKDEPYYEIESYIVAKEEGKMRIVGIRFFTRLF